MTPRRPFAANTTKITLTLTSAQIADLDSLATAIRAKTGTALSRSNLVSYAVERFLRDAHALGKAPTTSGESRIVKELLDKRGGK